MSAAAAFAAASAINASLSLLDAVAGREGDLAAADGTHLVERIVELRRVDLRASGALVARRAGELADDRDRTGCERVERQQPAVVLQQHGAVSGDLAGEGVVRLRVVGAALRGRWTSAVEQAQQPRDREVEHRFVQVSVTHRGDELRIGEPARRRHLQVQACLQARDAILDRTPIRHHEAVEAPLVAEHLGQQPRMLRRVGAVELVVRAHHRPRSAPA